MGIWGPAQYPLGGFPGDLVVRNLPVNVGDIRDVGLITGLGTSTGGEHGSPLQYSRLENPKAEKQGGLHSIGLQT